MSIGKEQAKAVELSCIGWSELLNVDHGSFSRVGYMKRMLGEIAAEELHSFRSTKNS